MSIKKSYIHLFLFHSMVIETQRMMKTVRSKRIKATVLYATETGRSKNYANIVKNLFDRTFNCSVYSMDEYNKANLEHEQLVLIVTSTFGSGDPPSNGEVVVCLFLFTILNCFVLVVWTLSIRSTSWSSRRVRSKGCG